MWCNLQHECIPQMRCLPIEIYRVTTNLFFKEWTMLQQKYNSTTDNPQANTITKAA